MARRRPDKMDETVRAEMMRLLRQRVEDPSKPWDWVSGLPTAEWIAGDLLKGATYLDENGRITLAGVDYYREETANPGLTWLRSNWFAVIVAGCTIGVSVWGIVGG